LTARSNSPVFVIGCHRSGTALLYDSLLSAGGFPLYHASPFVHTQMIQISGDPAVPNNREKLLQLWLRSKAFRRTGFGPDDLRSKILHDCKSGGDFLRITMGELARRAGVQRWAVYDIDNIMYMRTIKREIPDALFVHVVRDGRDAAVSMKKQHGGRPLLWARERGLFAWALLWQWTVRKGRRSGQKFPGDYIEIRYEDLVRDPEKTLSTLGEFLDHDLDYGRIQKAAVGRVSSPNTIWGEEFNQEKFSPIERWKSKLSESEAAALEVLIGDGLQEFGYPLTTELHSSVRLDPKLGFMRMLYPSYFESKVFLQSKTVLGRRAKGTRLELTDLV
jgi:LPS sulfotransferase NodH